MIPKDRTFCQQRSHFSDFRPSQRNSSRSRLVSHTFAMLLLIGGAICSPIIFMGCGKAAETGRTLSQWPMTQYKEVPFTTFGTVNHQITLEMQASTQRSRLVIDHSTYIDMPEKVVPLKCLELENGLILVFGKVMFTGQLRMFSVDAEGTHLVENKLPDELSYHIFEQAFVYRGQVLVVLFDVLKSEMKCYRWKISPDTNAPIVDPANYYHLAFNEDNIHVAEYRDKVYFVGEGLCYVYNENSGVGVLEQLELPGQLFVIELKSTPFGIAGLFLDEA